MFGPPRPKHFILGGLLPFDVSFSIMKYKIKA